MGRVDVEGGIGRDVWEELLKEAEPSMFSVEAGTEQFEADKDDQRIWLGPTAFSKVWGESVTPWVIIGIGEFGEPANREEGIEGNEVSTGPTEAGVDDD